MTADGERTPKQDERDRKGDAERRAAEEGMGERMKDEMSNAIKNAHRASGPVPSNERVKNVDGAAETAGETAYQRISMEHKEHNRRAKEERKAAAAKARDAAAENKTAADKAKAERAADLHRRAKAGDKTAYNYTPKQKATIDALKSAKPDAVDTDLVNINCENPKCPEVYRQRNPQGHVIGVDRYHTKEQYMACSRAAQSINGEGGGDMGRERGAVKRCQQDAGRETELAGRRRGAGKEGGGECKDEKGDGVWHQGCPQDAKKEGGGRSRSGP